MAYGLLEISEVGPAEYPLIEVLRHAILGDSPEVTGDGCGGRDLLTLIAHLEGNPVGYLVGSGQEIGNRFIIRSMAVLSDYQRRGLGTRMLDWAGRHAASRGYQEILLIVPRRDAAAAALSARFAMEPDEGGFTRQLQDWRPRP